MAPTPRSGEPSGEFDCVGQGTAVAGIIAASPTSGVGFHGMAPGVRVLDAKVVGDQYPSGRQPSGTVAPDTLASGIDWAVDQDATVIVVSTITYEDGGGLREAVDQALAAGSGTAMAAAYVAGTVALTRAYRSDLSPAEVAHRLFATATPAPEGVGSPRYGFGIVNPYQAVADRVVTGEPAGLPPYLPTEVTERERTRLAAQLFSPVR